MVSENFAREYRHIPANALGKQIRTDVKDEWREVVGIVGDVHQDGVDKEAPFRLFPALIPIKPDPAGFPLLSLPPETVGERASRLSRPLERAPTSGDLLLTDPRSIE
jgi:hypothetical protein